MQQVFAYKDDCQVHLKFPWVNLTDIFRVIFIRAFMLYKPWYSRTKQVIEVKPNETKHS